jgi:heat-inducible transcriptional repressor
VPTDKGYRLFVDRLATVRPMTSGEKRAITTFLDGAVDLDDVVQRSVRLLSQLTRQVAVVQYPTLTSSMVRHIELVEVAPTRLLVVLILSTGRVEQRLVETATPVAPDDLAAMRAWVNAATEGRTIADAALGLQHVPASPLAAPVVTTILEALSDERGAQRVAVAGASNLARYGDSFDTAVRPLLEALEEHVVLLTLLGEQAGGDSVTVRIGAEGPVQELAATSVVTAGYGPGAEAVAALGVVGPTRMDYPSAMGSVHAVARYLSRILDGN